MPVKLYNGNNVLIYQVDNGDGNNGKLPSGRALISKVSASSMNETVATPITIYWNPVISQSDQSGDLYNYYWTSYSRGTDGTWSTSTSVRPNWHNLYLDSYIPLKHKSIYDPCPYGYRIPSNGTYNQFTSNTRWDNGSYVGGTLWRGIWMCGLGVKYNYFEYTGTYGLYMMCTPSSSGTDYFLLYSSSMLDIRTNGNDHNKAYGLPVRCIEE